MKYEVLALVCAAAALVSCGRKETAAPVAAAAGSEETKRSLTDWTARTELFMEYPPLVAGKNGRWAVHLTRLDTFKAMAAGRVEAILTDASGTATTFRTSGPSSPGVFGVDVKPGAAGTYQLALTVTAPDLTDRHDLGTFTVFPSEEAAATQPQPKLKEETISFLKEQQWSLDYASEPVRGRTLRESILIPAQITARTGGEAEVTVPFDGRLVASALPPLGTEVAKGRLLAQVVPPTSSPSDVANLSLAREEAEASLNLARKETQRAQRLVEAGAIPTRRLEEAQTAEAVAAARLRAAESRLAQYEATRSAAEGGEANAFALRAPITGIVAETHATSGANVKSGEVLLRLVDVASVYVEGKLPEAELPRLAQFSGAQLETPGAARGVPLGKLVAVQKLVDPASRTVNIIYEAGNRDRSLAVGQAVSLRLTTGGAAEAPAVPESAIVDDGGRPVVFVQVAGESFARRPVTLGTHDNGYVQVVAGVRAGERAVTKGAYLIRLSAMSSQIPAHGHVH